MNTDNQQPIPSNGEKVYRWVKAVERKPDIKMQKVRLNIKWKGVPWTMLFIDNTVEPPHWVIWGYYTNAVHKKIYDVDPGHIEKQALWKDIEWLEEIPAPLNQPGIDREEKSQRIGQILQDARTKSGYTLNQVADETGIPLDYLTHLEMDKYKQPSAHALYKLASMYVIDLKELLLAAGVIIKKPDPQPVSAVNAPTEEIPEDIKEWIRNKYNEIWHHAGAIMEPGELAEEVAIAMYRKLQEDMPPTENPIASYWFEKARICLVDRNDFKAQLMRAQEENAALQASLSSIKGELQETKEALRIACNNEKALTHWWTETKADRDLYRKESEDLRKAWEEANEDRELKNIMLSKHQGWVKVESGLPEIGEYVLIYNTEGATLVGRRFSHDWVAMFSDGEKSMGELTATHWKPIPPEPNKYPKKEEPKP